VTLPSPPDPLPRPGEREQARRYPFGIDAHRLLELTSNCWRSHDGQWFLKAAERVGLTEAMQLNERAITSIARIELREFRRLSGLASLDTMEQVAEWYRLAWHIFGGIGRLAQRYVVVDADTLVVENAQCLAEAIAERSGYGHLGPGEYPPCRGWLERQRAWGDALSSRYRFTVAREPANGHPCRYVVRRAPRDPTS
jgi:Family of unknown function (DUF6125)